MGGGLGLSINVWASASQNSNMGNARIMRKWKKKGPRRLGDGSSTRKHESHKYLYHQCVASSNRVREEMSQSCLILLMKGESLTEDRYTKFITLQLVAHPVNHVAIHSFQTASVDF